MNNPIPLDPHSRPILTTDWACSVDKLMTFAGGTANDPGDYDGTGNPATLFTITGTVLLRILAKCTDSLTGASATIEVGTALLTTGMIPLTTATEIDVNEIWHDATPDSSLEATTVLTQQIVAQDIIQTVRTANITGGSIKYTALWYPLSADGNVVAA
jgi:hypothetical protein